MNQHSHHHICAGFQTGRKQTPLFYSQSVRSDSLTLFGRAQLLWISAWKAASASRSRPFFSSCLCKDSSTGSTYCTQYMASAESSATIKASWHTAQCTRSLDMLYERASVTKCMQCAVPSWCPWACNDPAMSNQNAHSPLVVHVWV